MWTVLKEKIRNVKVKDDEYKTFNVGETLPEGYEPPKSYIEQGLVGETKKKKREVTNG